MQNNNITQIRKRSGEIVNFEPAKVTNAILKAAESVGIQDKELAQMLSDQVVKILNEKFHARSIPAVEEVQDIVEEILIENRRIKMAKAYILYRDQRARLREMKSMINSNDLMDGYLKKSDWRIKENSNMSYSLQGLNNHLASAISSNYWLNKVYTAKIREAHKNGDLHIHDLQLLAPYCAGWDLKDLLIQGFGGVSGKIESKPANHFRTALGQIINFFYTLQGEVAGAEAFSNFDTYLAPFIRHDRLNFKEVKQCLQEFLFNINVPTRVGFQCMSEDTEILGKDGWKKHNQVKKSDIIATFNIEKGFIEYLPVKHVFAKKYKGKMYNLKNRISDQLISPEHRVVRKKFYAEGYILEKIEKILDLKSPFIVPVGSEGNVKGSCNIDEDIVKLIAWIVAEGSCDKSGRGTGRISIYQSKEKSSENYEEIISICRKLKLKWSERTQKGLGAECNVIRFDAYSTKKIFHWFKSNKNQGIKFIPEIIISADTETSKIFLETYIKGDGHEECKITTASADIKDGLFQVIVNAGFGATVLLRNPDNELSKKDRYIIRIIKHKDTYINTIKQINYDGIIWCPNTDNETVIARRNGKIFITGNTPFTNITMDLTPGKTVGEENTIIGGQVQKEKYKDFQEEMDMINIAFAELMMGGDAKGRVFTFPIPTYNITNDFSWDSPVAEKVFEMTAKYGIPYFSNFINSDMNPDDARSMCCRLRLDNRELKIRGGGLFAANPLTGSIGVVTLNLPRVGYLSKTKEEFFDNLSNLMQIARESLEIKRTVLEDLTNNGLYPYAQHYLAGIKQRFGSYWQNHFSTIGIIGMNEALLNFAPIKNNIASGEGKKFALEIMDFMRNKMLDFQNKTNNLYNLEATPAEGVTRRMAKKDKEKFNDIIVANEKDARTDKFAPYYTNSSQLPVNYTDDIFEALDLQDDIQTKYTGGTVLHCFIGEALPSAEAVKKLVKKIAKNYRLPYFTITPTFSICPKHGYLSGEHFFCPKCDQEIGCAESSSQQMERDIVAAMA
ncbi:ribonucleoside triphosphate reductase [Candidatus Parcubacteria bacterium]|nr:ribonucleoside triphosphate reductase [Candidatus Parcubacteria bacterium]